MVYLTTLSVVQLMLMIDEFKRLWKEEVVPKCKSTSHNFQEGNKENHDKSQSGWPVRGAIFHDVRDASYKFWTTKEKD